MMNKYFTKRRGLANGIAFSGSGLGASVFPFFYQYLTTEYSVRGALIVVAGLWFNMSVTGALMRPVTRKRIEQAANKNSENDEISKEPKISYIRRPSLCDGYTLEMSQTIQNVSCDPAMSNIKFGRNSIDKNADFYTDANNVTHVKVEVHATQDGISICDTKHSAYNSKDKCETNNNVGNIKTEELTTKTTASYNNIKNQIEKDKDTEPSLCSSLCSISFLTHCLFWFAGLFGFFGILQFIPPHVQDLNLTKTQASTLLTIIGAVDLVARLLFGLIGDIKWVNKKAVLTFNFLISGIATILFSFLSTWELIVGYSVVLGLCGGSFMVYMGPLVIDAIGMDYVGTGIGISSMLFGLANTLAPLTFGK